MANMTKMSSLVYGLGDCPVLGGTPALLNCGFCHDADDCVRRGIVPVCVSCLRQRSCSFAPTQSCSLFVGDDEDHYERRELERERFCRQNDAWITGGHEQ